MLSEILSIAAFFLLVSLLMWIANLAQKRREEGQPYQGIALVSYLALVFGYGLAFLFGLMFQAMDAIIATQPQLLEEAGLGNDGTPFGQMSSPQLFSLGLWLPALAGIVLLLPPVRRLIARFIPIDPDSPVHAVALSMTSLVVASLLITLGVGLGTLADALEQQGDGGGGISMAALWAQQIFTALFAMVGVGYLVRRGPGSTFERLGLVTPTLRQVLVAIGLAILLVPLVIAVDYVGTLLGVGENTDVERLSEQLLGPLFRSPFGIFTVGAAAAIGEETLLRGALQPRFGLLFTTVIFALLHSNYGLSISTVIVFVLGLILGIVRIRANTTTAMIVHGVYNSSLALLVYLGM
jgi:membrane protease YdiL (CAAX protease family)